MFTFILSLILLVTGYFVYGAVVEKFFGIDTQLQTPAITKNDGVDFVPMSGWRIFLVQFLNIAGLGPIFGAIMGVFFGPSAFLWIVFGTIFAGGVHDFMSGMMSTRKGGISLPEIVGSELGSKIKLFMNVLALVLLILLTTTFLSGPAGLLQNMVALPTITLKTSTVPIVWLLIIFVYYCLATVLPIDKLIGQFYPIFGGVLLLMGILIMFVMLGYHSSDMLELSDGLYNRRGATYPLFPMMFVSIACGAISGFHGTQSPLMARCITNERQGRTIFYGAMVAEGILALIWAAAASSFFADATHGLTGLDGLKAFAAQHQGENIAALVVNAISRSWLGKLGGILVVLGVIVAPITSGDTALRSARLIIADYLHLSQQPRINRIKVALPLWILVFIMVFVNFDIVWRYFAWTNQSLSVFTLWAATVFLYKNAKPALHIGSISYRYAYLLTLIPALFMTMVTVSYIFIAPEGFGLAQTKVGYIAYIIAAVVTLALLTFFIHATRQIDKKWG